MRMSSTVAAPAVNRAPAATEPAALELVGVSKSYKGVEAVADVSVRVDAGEFVSLVGPSGCGKTTTLNIVGGFAAPDGGDVVIHGERVTDRPPNKRDIGMVFQSYALFPHKTITENVGYGLRMRKVAKPERAQRVADALAMVGLDNVGDRRPGQLSGGQQQRVALARALVINPSLLLLDEPLSNLDAALRRQMRAELKQIQRRVGASTLFVTHDQEEALAMSDRVVVLNAGRIEQVGTPQEIYRRPATPFVAQFIGESNVWEGALQRAADGSVELALDSGLRIAVDGDRARGVDGRVLLTVRPEAIRLQRADAAASADDANRFEGVVVASSYLGATVEYRVRVAESETVHVTCGGEEEWHRDGERVVVSWPASACGVVP